jgi:proteasome accessory factor C
VADPNPRTPVYVRRFAEIPRYLAIVARYPDGLPLATLAELVDRGADEVREDLLAYYTADYVVGDSVRGLPLAMLEFVGPDGEDDDPATAAVVRVTDPRPEGELGVVHVNATAPAVLYTAARDLAALEADNTDLVAAIEVLEETMLGEAPVSLVPPRPELLATTLREAQRDRRRVRIRYSRAWRPGVSERVIEPYRLQRTRRGWEVDAGPLDDDGAPRTFLVANIREATPLEETFEEPPEAAAAIATSRTPHQVEVVLPQRTRWVADRFAEAVEVLSEDDDSQLLSLAVLPPVDQRVGLLVLVAGPGAFVRDPPELRDADRTLARALLAHHRGEA